MDSKIFDFFCCPVCSSDFNLKVLTQIGSEIIEGSLNCKACGVKFPIKDKIPRMLTRSVTKSERKTADSFEFAWQRYGPLLSDNLNSEFLTLVKPWKESDFVDRIVLDVGCGAGRLSRLASSYGARHVFSIDLGCAVDVAQKLSINYPNIHYIQSSLFHLPFKIRFDIIFSLGVLHHTLNPFQGFKSILKFLKQGGSVGIWVYGKEGNEIMGPLLNMFRIITTRLNHRTRVYFAKSIVKTEEIFYRFSNRLTSEFFYSEYLKYFNTHLSSVDREYVAFDFMTTPLVKYISRKELENWVTYEKLSDILIMKRNFNSWGLTARKK